MLDCTVIIPTHFWDPQLQTKIEELLSAGLTVRIICDGFEVPEIDSHPNLQFFSTMENIGPNCARNIGLRGVTTTWLTFLDSDDHLNISGLQDLISLLQNRQSSAVNVICGSLKFKNVAMDAVFDSHKHISLQKITNPLESLCTGKLPAVCWGRLYRSTIFEGTRFNFPKSKKHGRDILFSRNLAINIDMWFAANIVLVLSDKRRTSFSRTFSMRNVLSALSLTYVSLAVNRQNKKLESVGNLRHLKYIALLAGFRLLNFSDFSKSLLLIKRQANDIVKTNTVLTRSSLASLLFIRLFTFCPSTSWVLMKFVRKLYQPY